MTTIPAHVAITEAAIGGKVLLFLFVWLISGAAGSLNKMIARMPHEIMIRAIHFRALHRSTMMEPGISRIT